MRDVVVIGAGLAGLSAAWHLRDLDIVVLEQSGRTGGRVLSEPRGSYWMNWGGHVFHGANSATETLLEAVRVEAAPVPGLLTGLSMNGKLLLGGHVEAYPFRFRTTWRSRAAMIRAGAKVRLGVRQYAEAARPRPNEHYSERQQRIYDFRDDQSFTDFVGRLPADADALFRPTVSRSTGEPEQVSAGAGIGYFHLVWNKGEGLSRNILGGPSKFTAALAEPLGAKLELGASVVEVVRHRRSVTVVYDRGGSTHEIEALYAVLATPAPITRKVAVNIDDGVGQALDRIEYGPHVSVGYLTDETEPQRWDNTYAIATPKRAFSVIVNVSNLARAREPERRQGSSLMAFAPANAGRRLLELSDDEVLSSCTRDLDEVLEGIGSHVIEASVRRWPLGSAYCFPGRGRIQAALTKPMDRLFLAGDYLGTWYTETAIQTGTKAAHDIRAALGAPASQSTG